MALTNQPYLPLYIQDWLTNNKLKQCSLGSHGLMINIMCLMHKEDTYGKILLKQKFKQTDKLIKNFASMLAKLLPFDFADIEIFLLELIEEKILKINGDFLICERMVNDAEISYSRAKSGKKGGKKTQQNMASTFALAKSKANAEYENEYNNTNTITIIKQGNENFNTMPTLENFNGLPNQYLKSSVEIIDRTKKIKIGNEDILGMWEIFKIKNLTGKNYYANEGKFYNHFIEWIKLQPFKEIKLDQKTPTIKKESEIDFEKYRKK